MVLQQTSTCASPAIWHLQALQVVLINNYIIYLTRSRTVPHRSSPLYAHITRCTERSPHGIGIFPNVILLRVCSSKFLGTASPMRIAHVRYHGSRAWKSVKLSTASIVVQCSSISTAVTPSVGLVTRISGTARTGLGTWYSVRVTRLLLLVLFHSHISKPIRLVTQVRHVLTTRALLTNARDSSFR
jgi:hypothetical protein